MVETVASCKPKHFVRSVRPAVVIQALVALCAEPGILEAEDEDDEIARNIGCEVGHDPFTR